MPKCMCQPRTDLTYVYGLIDPRTDAIRYVGITNHDVNERLRNHFESIREKNNTSHRKMWLLSLKRIGLKPTIIVLDEVPPEIGGVCESNWISFLRDIGEPLTNSTEGGEKNYSFLPEVRKKISARRIEHWRNISDEDYAEFCKKESEGHLKWWKDHVMSKETRNKLRANWLGRRHTDETRRMMSLRRKGKPGHPHSLETRRKIGDSQRGLKKPPLSLEARRKISMAMKGRVFSEERNRKISLTRTGMKFTPEHCANISRAKKGISHPHTPETCAKISLALRGIKRTMEQRIRISLGVKEYYRRKKESIDKSSGGGA